MLSIQKDVGAQYFLSEAGWRVDARTGYYTRAEGGAPEREGAWFNPSRQFGIGDGSPVDPRAFANLHAGISLDGMPLICNAGASRRVSGYDLTFSAPKSVSVLWGLGSEALRQDIEQAHEAAVRTVLGHIDRLVASTRVGHNGEQRVPAHITAALWQHGSARPTRQVDDEGETVDRPGDPQLHTHCYVVNLTHCADGKVRTLDGAALYATKMAVGALYRAELADQLHRRLGVAITPLGDSFEIDGVPDALIELFSKRSRGVGMATTSAKEKERAILASRLGKDGREPPGQRHARWRAEALAAGFPPQSLAGCLDAARDTSDREGLDAKLASLAADLTATSSVVPEARIWQTVAVAHQGHGGYGAVSAEVERQLSGTFLCVGEDGRGQPLYTTPALLEAEAAVETAAGLLSSGHSHRLDNITVDRALASEGAMLSDEQREAVVWATTGPDLAVVEGGAGTGKSFSLRLVASLYRNAGYRVVGAAAAWRVARQLGEECGVDGRATAKWLSDLTRGTETWDHRTAVIVDEAGMTDACEMRRILDAAVAAGAKVVLTGDRKQLLPIGPGPGLGIAVGALGRGLRLRQTRRQLLEEDRWIATWTGDGEADKALAALDQRGLLHLTEDWQETIDQAVANWARFTEINPARTTLIMAQTNCEIRAINGRIREVLKGRGVIAASPEVIIQAGSPSGSSAPLALAAGDTVRFYRRDDDFGIINGTTGRVVAVTAAEGGHAELDLEIEGRRVRIHSRRLVDPDIGHVLLGHSNACTVHGAQGLTVDDAWAVLAGGSRMATRNSAYVALSRNRHQVHLFVNQGAVVQDLADRGDDPPDRDAVIAKIAADLSKAGVKHSALEMLRRNADAREKLADSLAGLQRTAMELRRAVGQFRQTVVDLAKTVAAPARGIRWSDRLRALAGIATTQADPPGPGPDLLRHLSREVMDQLGRDGIPDVIPVPGARLRSPIPHRVLDFVHDRLKVRLRDTGAEIRLAWSSADDGDTTARQMIRSVAKAIGRASRRGGWTSVSITGADDVVAALQQGLMPSEPPTASQIKAEPPQKPTASHSADPPTPPVVGQCMRRERTSQQRARTRSGQER